MGASYSYNVNPTSSSSVNDQLKQDTPTESQTTQNKEIFVLFLDQNPLCYSYKFNTIFEKAVSIKNKICYDLITSHGATFSVSTKEDTDNSSFYNANLLTREINCLISRENIHQSIRISKLRHVDEDISEEIQNALDNNLYDNDPETREVVNNESSDTVENKESVENKEENHDEDNNNNDHEVENNYEVHEEEDENNEDENDKTE
jgi:hypothetical protein